MHRNYATLNDVKYLPRMLALYDSLVRHSSEPFTLHVLCMDSETFWLLDAMDLPHVRLYPLDSFEKAMHMEPVKSSRSWVEYLWTCASSFMEFMLKSYDIPELTYLDADLFVFSDPVVVFEEMGARSIAIVPHRFADQDRARLEKNGKFNVGWLTIARNNPGIDCVSRWAEQCREWCFHRNEDGKFADQGYLNDWPFRYGPWCAVIQNIGVGVAPWNLQQYRTGIIRESNQVCVNGQRIVVYHFHEWKGPSQLTNYPLRLADIALIYTPYNQAIRAAEDRIAQAKNKIAERHLRNSEQAVRA